MILFTILLLTALLVIGFVVLTVSLFGATTIILFGDAIVCVVFIVLLIKFIIKHH